MKRLRRRHGRAKARTYEVQVQSKDARPAAPWDVLATPSSLEAAIAQVQSYPVGRFPNSRIRVKRGRIIEYDRDGDKLPPPSAAQMFAELSARQKQAR